MMWKRFYVCIVLKCFRFILSTSLNFVLGTKLDVLGTKLDVLGTKLDVLGTKLDLTKT